MKPLTIVGKGTGFEQALLDDKTGCFIWATSTAFRQLEKVGCRVDRIFQLHSVDNFEDWIRQEQDRVVLMDDVDGYEGATILPSDELVSKFGNHFGGSISWMLGLAILEGFREIRFHGIHLSHFTEYGPQRDSFFFLAGWAESLGVKIVTDSTSGIAFAKQTYGRA